MSEMEIGSQLSFEEFLNLMNKLETRLLVQDNVGKLSGEKSWSPRKGKSEASQWVKKDQSDSGLSSGFASQKPKPV